MANAKWGNNKDANQFQLLNYVLQHILGDHGSPSEGMPWWDSSNKVAKIFDGTDPRTIAFLEDIVAGGNAETLETHAAAYFLARANHTGTQAASSISDFSSAVTALLTSYATQTYVNDAISVLTSGAPGALNTLDELAAALGDDANFGASVTTALGLRGRGKAFTVGDGSATSFNLDHNFGTKDVMCQAYILSNGAQYEPDFDRTTTNRVVVSFGVAPATNTVRALIQEIPTSG